MLQAMNRNLARDVIYMCSWFGYTHASCGIQSWNLRNWNRDPALRASGRTDSSKVKHWSRRWEKEEGKTEGEYVIIQGEAGYVTESVEYSVWVGRKKCTLLLSHQTYPSMAAVLEGRCSLDRMRESWPDSPCIITYSPSVFPSSFSHLRLQCFTLLLSVLPLALKAGSLFQFLRFQDCIPQLACVYPNHGHIYHVPREVSVHCLQHWWWVVVCIWALKKIMKRVYTVHDPNLLLNLGQNFRVPEEEVFLLAKLDRVPAPSW